MNDIKTTEQDIANGLAGADSTLHQASRSLGKAMDRAADQLSNMAHQSADALRHESDVLADQARRARRNTAAYIRHDPIRSILLAAAAGAGVAVLLSLLRPGKRKHQQEPPR